MSVDVDSDRECEVEDLESLDRETEEVVKLVGVEDTVERVVKPGVESVVKLAMVEPVVELARELAMLGPAGEIDRVEPPPTVET